MGEARGAAIGPAAAAVAAVADGMAATAAEGAARRAALYASLLVLLGSKSGQVRLSAACLRLAPIAKTVLAEARRDVEMSMLATAAQAVSAISGGDEGGDGGTIVDRIAAKAVQARKGELIEHVPAVLRQQGTRGFREGFVACLEACEQILSEGR